MLFNFLFNFVIDLYRFFKGYNYLTLINYIIYEKYTNFYSLVVIYHKEINYFNVSTKI